MISFLSRFWAVIGVLAISACGSAQPIQSEQDFDGVTRIATPGKATCAAATPAEVSAFLAATNRQRAQHGLPPVSVSANLNQAASNHACDMAGRATMTHRGSDGSMPSQRVKATGYRPALTAENIAAQYRSHEQVFERWYLSPSHRQNLLISNVSEVGFGHALAADGKTRFWAALYSRPR